jgi:hypothetical protein
VSDMQVTVIGSLRYDKVEVAIGGEVPPPWNIAVDTSSDPALVGKTVYVEGVPGLEAWRGRRVRVDCTLITVGVESRRQVTSAITYFGAA